MKTLRILAAAALFIFCRLVSGEEETRFPTYYWAPFGEHQELRAQKAILGKIGAPAPEDGDTVTVYGNAQFNNSIANIGPDPAGPPPASTAPYGLSVNGLWIDPAMGGGTVSGRYTGSGAAQTISLSFRPKWVGIISDGIHGVAFDAGQAGTFDMAQVCTGPTPGGPFGTSWPPQAQTGVITILNGGFRVRQSLNQNGRPYVYVAQR